MFPDTLKLIQENVLDVVENAKNAKIAQIIAQNVLNLLTKYLIQVYANVPLGMKKMQMVSV